MCGCGVETPSSPCGQHPQPGQGSPEGSGDTNSVSVAPGDDSPCWGQRPSCPRGWQYPAGRCCLMGQRGALPVPAPVRGSSHHLQVLGAPGWGRGRAALAQLCPRVPSPAEVSWGSHAVPRPSPAHGSGAPAPVGTVPLPGIAGTPWHHPPLSRGDSGSHPARRPLTWVPVARAGHGRGWLGACPPCRCARCARRSCCRCHLHTTDSSCSSGAEP